jgi:hypothetical protein
LGRGEGLRGGAGRGEARRGEFEGTGFPGEGERGWRVEGGGDGFDGLRGWGFEGWVVRAEGASGGRVAQGGEIPPGAASPHTIRELRPHASPLHGSRVSFQNLRGRSLTVRPLGSPARHQEMGESGWSRRFSFVHGYRSRHKRTCDPNWGRGVHEPSRCLGGSAHFCYAHPDRSRAQPPEQITCRGNDEAQCPPPSRRPVFPRISRRPPEA